MSNVSTDFISPSIGPIHLGAMIGRGKEGATYRIVGHPHLVAKIYHAPPSPKTIRKLEVMISNPPVAPVTGSQRPVLAWPQSLMHNRGGVVSGFVMPVVEPTWSINQLFYPEKRAKLQTSTNTRVGWHHLHEIARNLALVVSSCHESGYVVGDLNNLNIRVYTDGQVCLIDTDSFQVPDTSHRPLTVHHCEVVFPDYSPPELLGKNLGTFDRMPASDCYTLAVLIFMILQDGMHPFAAATSANPPLDPTAVMQARNFPYDANRRDRSIKPYPRAPSFGRLHPQLRRLFLQAFTTGLDSPARRPSASEWEQSLAVARSSLRKCARGHYFVIQPGTRCMQTVAAKGGGYCGASETEKTTTPIPFNEIDPITGIRANISANTHAAPPTAVPPPPSTPPPPKAPHAVTGQQQPHSKRSLRKIALGLAIVGLLGWSIYHDVRNQTPGTTTDLPVPTSVAQVFTHTPQPAATETSFESFPIPPTVTQQRLPNPAPQSWKEVVTAAQSNESLIYSAKLNQLWSLYIAIPSTGQIGTIIGSMSVDPSPALSHSGNKLAYIVKAGDSYLIRILDLTDFRFESIALSEAIQVPTNIEWTSEDASLLVTHLADDEPHISIIDINSGNVFDFLPPWSANPSISSNGTMVYVVPQKAGSTNLGIVLAHADGIATIFVANGVADENYPSLSSGAVFMTYDIAAPDTEGHILGISSVAIADEMFTEKVNALAIRSDSPVRTHWLGDNRLFVGFCIQTSCEILTIAADGSPESVFSIPNAQELGNILVRPR